MKGRQKRKKNCGNCLDHWKSYNFDRQDQAI